MSATTAESKAQFDIIASYCRYNTGSHFLDSGSAYGRHWQKPPITKDDKAVTLECWGRGSGNLDDRDPEINATINTAHYLDAGFDLDMEIMARFEEFVEKDESNDNWFEVSNRFCSEVLGLHQHSRENVYNNENDLSQVFVWEVWTENENESDWLYANDALCVIFVHTGCDVRGGYARPMFMRSKGSYSIQFDWVAQFYAAEGTDADGEELVEHELREIDEKWQCGYSSLPSSQLSKDVERVVGFEDGGDTVTVLLKTGETVKVVASMPYLES